MPEIPAADAPPCPVCVHPQRREIDLHLFCGHEQAVIAAKIDPFPGMSALQFHALDGHMQVDTALVCTALVELTRQCQDIVHRSLITGTKPPQKHREMNGTRIPDIRPQSDVTQQFGATALRMGFQVMLIHAKLQGVGEPGGSAASINPEDLKALVAYMENHDSDAALRAMRITARQTETLDVLPKGQHAADPHRKGRPPKARHIDGTPV